MPWAGGTFSRTNGTYTGSAVWQSDRAAAVKIRADRHDTHDADLASGINNCLTKDGQNAPTANISWGNFKLINLGNGTAATDAVNKGQLDTKQDALGFTPVQQGTGVGQLANPVKIGWSGTKIKATVDVTDLGNIALESWVSANYATSVSVAAGYVALTGAQTVAGAKTFSSLLNAQAGLDAINGAQGFNLRWNAVSGGSGQTEFINNRGGGGGGFAWYDRVDIGSATGPSLMDLTSGGLRLGAGFRILNVTVSSAAPGALAQGSVHFRY